MADYEPFITRDSGVLITSDKQQFYVVANVTQFDIVLYQMSCSKITVDKTEYLTEITTLSGTLRQSCNIVNPTIIIEMNDVPVFNYVYIEKFNRYYYVNDVTNIVNGIWQISLKVDVLNTYKDEIKDQQAIITRQETLQNKYIADNLIPVTSEVETTMYNCSTDSSYVFDNSTTTPLYVLRTVKGA